MIFNKEEKLKSDKEFIATLVFKYSKRIKNCKDV